MSGNTTAQVNHSEGAEVAVGGANICVGGLTLYFATTHNFDHFKLGVAICAAVLAYACYVYVTLACRQGVLRFVAMPLIWGLMVLDAWGFAHYVHPHVVVFNMFVTGVVAALGLPGLSIALTYWRRMKV